MVNSKDKSKYEIVNYIFNSFCSLDIWTEVTKSIDINKSAIIGYHMSTIITRGVPAYVVNLYVIDRHYYSGLEVTQSSLNKAWEQFSHNPSERQFQNPPVKEWFDSKINWCKKLANKICEEYGEQFDEVLSLIYFVILKLFKREHVYIGNLGYIEKSVYNELHLAFRQRKHQPLILSLDETISDDDDSLRLEDLIAHDDSMSDETLEYKELYNKAHELLSKHFSEREIDSILNTPQNCLPRQTYIKLVKFRHDYSVSDLYR